MLGPQHSIQRSQRYSVRRLSLWRPCFRQDVGPTCPSRASLGAKKFPRWHDGRDSFFPDAASIKPSINRGWLAVNGSQQQRVPISNGHAKYLPVKALYFKCPIALERPSPSRQYEGHDISPLCGCPGHSLLDVRQMSQPPIDGCPRTEALPDSKICVVIRS